MNNVRAKRARENGEPLLEASDPKIIELRKIQREMEKMIQKSILGTQMSPDLSFSFEFENIRKKTDEYKMKMKEKIENLTKQNESLQKEISEKEKTLRQKDATIEVLTQTTQNEYRNALTTALGGVIQQEIRTKECGICMNLYGTNERQLCCFQECGHTLCVECAKHITKKSMPICPKCRQLVHPNGIVRVYFS